MPDIDIGQLSETINDKMDLDGNNANPPLVRLSGLEELYTEINNLKNKVNKMLGRMDYNSAVSVTSSALGSTYTCPSDGFIVAAHAGSSAGTLKINNITSFTLGRDSAFLDFLPVSEGDIISLSSGVSCYFVPQKNN